MKTMKVLIVLGILFALFGCRMSGSGPIHVAASYPGQFYLQVGMWGPSGHEVNDLRPSPSLTYSGDFFAGKELWYLGVYAHKRPPEVPVPTDLGALEVTVTGDFGTLHAIAPFGSWEPIGLSKSWDHY